ncbi:MAG: histidine kinase dimerization/phospho-acceptor domain-containing protein, partial [Gammaproteobacteria bacterium]
MTIRHTLFISYLGVSLTSALLITLMIFTHLRDYLNSEIEKKLESQAVILMQQIDVALFERMKNLSIWSRLEIMQDIRIRDIDKRLSSFLHELQSGYAGVYRQLFVVDNAKEIIAAGDPTLIGSRHRSPAMPWLSSQLGRHRIELERLDRENDSLLLSVGLIDAFRFEPIGELYAAFDWAEVLRLLQTPLLYQFPDVPSYAFLLDRHKNVIAVSRGGEKTRDADIEVPGDWHFDDVSGTIRTGVSELGIKSGLAGYACSKGYRTFEGLGWCAVILQPSEYAFAKIEYVWQTILIFLTATFLLSILLAIAFSERFAGPIVKLARFTRDFMQGEKIDFPYIKASGEVAELSRQFSKMIENLEQSRSDIVRVAKLAVVGEMAASMAHEVRTPLGILRSSAQLLEREPQLSEVGKELTGFILSETQRLNELVTTLLECAKPRPPVFDTQHVGVLLEHTLNLLQVQRE